MEKEDLANALSIMLKNPPLFEKWIQEVGEGDDTKDLITNIFIRLEDHMNSKENNNSDEQSFQDSIHTFLSFTSILLKKIGLLSIFNQSWSSIIS